VAAGKMLCGSVLCKKEKKKGDRRTKTPHDEWRKKRRKYVTVVNELSSASSPIGKRRGGKTPSYRKIKKKQKSRKKRKN